MRDAPAEAFYHPLGDDRFASTAATGGPWDPTAQHGGPPAALLARAIERCQPREGFTVARIACEILGPVPIAELTVRAHVTRPGRSVELVEAELAAGGRIALRARAWRVRSAPAHVPADASVGPGAAVPPLPDVPMPMELGAWHDGYLSAIEWRSVSGSFAEPGPATVWTRARVPLVSGEPISPLQRVMLVADSGNGISNVLPIADWWFINPELTVHLNRLPDGEWVAVDATTTVTAGGAGLAESRLFDRAGAIGRGAQALYVAPR